MSKIKLTEQQLHSVIREAVNNVLNEMIGEASPIPYDKDFLVGIDSIDARSINYFIKAMIPEGNRVSVNSPYKAIRQLVLYFSPEGATKHGGRLTKDIVNNIMKDDALKSKVFEITQCDKKIINLIYGKNRLTGKPLMQEIVWNLDAILQALIQFNEIVNNSNARNYFNGTEAMNGSADGKRVGLMTIMFNAVKGIDEIKKQIKTMQELLDKGNDAFSYYTGRTRR